MDLAESLEHLPKVIAKQAEACAERCWQIGGVFLKYVGAGQTSIVFAGLLEPFGICAFKCGRVDQTDDEHAAFRREQIANEYDFLRTVSREPSVGGSVARPFAFYDGPIILVREYVEPRSEAYPYPGKRLWDLYSRIRLVGLRAGWVGVEFKEDSFVMTRRGPVLVDAGFSVPAGWRYARHVRDILSGRKRSSDSAEDLAFGLSAEVSSGRLPAPVGESLAAALRQRSL